MNSKLAQLWSEIAESWRDLPNRAFFFALLGLWLCFFHLLGNSTFGYVDTPSLLGWMLNAYNAPDSDDAHGNFIPLIVLVLLYWKRKDLLTVPKSFWPPGLMWLAIAVLVHWVGYMIQQPRISIAALFAGIYALIGLAWGKPFLKAVAFPYVLFVFCVPVGSLAESITFPLRMLVTWISTGLSQHLLGIDVLREGSKIIAPDRSFIYDVAPACSGIRSLISLLAMTTIYGFVKFRTPWKRALMIGITLPLAVVGNVARLLSVIITADLWGFKAGEKVHEGAGFITFVVAIICVVALGHALRETPAPTITEAQTV